MHCLLERRLAILEEYREFFADFAVFHELLVAFLRLSPRVIQELESCYSSKSPANCFQLIFLVCFAFLLQSFLLNILPPFSPEFASYFLPSSVPIHSSYSSCIILHVKSCVCGPEHLCVKWSIIPCEDCSRDAPSYRVPAGEPLLGSSPECSHYLSYI